jgi:hypothetical protein
VVIKAKFQAAESAGVLDLLSADVRAIVSSGAECDLEPDEVEKITAHFNLAFEPGALPVRIRPAYRHDDLPYLVHDGRELALMLEGRKPLAVFSLWNPLRPDRELFPEKVFDPHVDSGEFIKRERSHPARESSGERIPAARTILYALPPHAWRIDAY